MGAVQTQATAVHPSRAAETLQSLSAIHMRQLAKAARLRLLRLHSEANVGHLGGNLSAIDALLVLYHRILTPSDLFVLSKAHAAGALYVTLWTKGLLSEQDLLTFHQDGTLLGGHPVPGSSTEIPIAAGSLGHGFPCAVGLALGKRLQNQPGHVYCLTSDGEWQEGSNWEALIFAAHQRLANLTILVDQNGLQGFGSTAEVASFGDLAGRFASFNVDVFSAEGHDLSDIESIASMHPNDRTRIIILRTVKGKGVSFMENQMAWHYLPMSASQYESAVAQVIAS